MLICPIRYDGGARPEDYQLWVELRRRLAHSSTELLGFIAVSGPSYWVDQFVPVKAQRESATL